MGAFVTIRAMTFFKGTIMGFTSIWHWIIVLAVVLILFARPGKISRIMGDFGKGLRSQRRGEKS